MFKFEKLEIWIKAVELAKELFAVADILESKKRFKFAEQLRGAALSMPNNIAEGSGSDTDADFARFINIAKRSAYENANMVIIFSEYIDDATKQHLLTELEILCRMMVNFNKTLRKDKTISHRP